MRAIGKLRRTLSRGAESALTPSQRAAVKYLLSSGPMAIAAVVAVVVYLVASVVATVNLQNVGYLGFDWAMPQCLEDSQAFQDARAAQDHEATRAALEDCERTIGRLEPGGAAEQAGLRRRDLVLSADGTAFLLDGPPPWLFGRIGEVVALQLRREDAAEGTEVIDATVRVEQVPWWWLPGLFPVLGALYLGIAVLASFARRGDPAAAPLLICCGGLALRLPADIWAVGLPPHDPSGAAFLLVNQYLLPSIVISGMLHLALAFPAPHPALVRLRDLGPRWLRRVGGATLLLYLVPVPITALAPQAPGGEPLGWLPLTILAALALVRSYRRSTSPLERAQLRWVTWSFLVAFLGPFLLNLLWDVLPREVRDPGYAYWPLPVVWPVAFFPVGLGFAILRYRLVDVDRILRATLLYPLLGIALVGAYDALSMVASRTTVTMLGINATDSPLVYLVMVGALALTWKPLRQFLNRAIDRVFYADRIVRRRFVDEMWAYVDETPGVDALTEALARQARDELKLADAWLLLADGTSLSGTGQAAPDGRSALLANAAELREPAQIVSGAEALVAETAVLPAEEPPWASWYEASARLIVPLKGSPPAVAAGASNLRPVVGLWILGRRASGGLYDREDAAAFGRLAAHAALAIENAILRAAPRAARR